MNNPFLETGDEQLDRWLKQYWSTLETVSIVPGVGITNGLNAILHRMTDFRHRLSKVLERANNPDLTEFKSRMETLKGKYVERLERLKKRLDAVKNMDENQHHLRAKSIHLYKTCIGLVEKIIKQLDASIALLNLEVETNE